MDEKQMKLAIRLAEKGMGHCSPNPPVGAVIVKSGEVIGKGYHQKTGEGHAEVNAIKNCKVSPKGADIYVTLEPCNHSGRTGPCTEAIIKAGIKRVFVGAKDPNEDVKGSGMDFLRNNNIEVIPGVLEAECKELIKYFTSYILRKRPWYIYKSAASIDGKTATSTGKSQWITSNEARIDGHKLRNKVDAILIGKQTFLHDNPSLTTRIPRKRTRNPVRLILNPDLSFPPQCNFDKIEPLDKTIFFYDKKRVNKSKINDVANKGFTLFPLSRQNDGFDLEELSGFLYMQGITSVLIEGGGNTAWRFFQKDLIDEQILYLAPRIIGGNNALGIIGGTGFTDLSNNPSLKEVSVKKIGIDLKVTGKIYY